SQPETKGDDSILRSLMAKPKRRSRGSPVGSRTRRYRVYAALSVQELAKAGSSINLYVHRDRQQLGELDIGRRALYWKGGNKHRWKRISWSRLPHMMDDFAYRKQ